ncbi:MAG: ferredoxin [Candidatus Omnitrophota bacterium]|nr:MAG: ferredoxin [Candidatus Omnitrophota bacterium]
MAKVIIDANACVGCGLCVNSCPDCFDMGENGIAIVKVSECSSCDLSEVASQCPVNAVLIEE